MINSKHLTTALAVAIAGLAEQLKNHYDGADPKTIVTECLMHADNLQGFLEKFKQQQESKMIPGITPEPKEISDNLEDFMWRNDQ